MSGNFIACDREQAWLMPPSLREWLPQDHFAWFVLDAVARMDLAAIYAVYSDEGRPAHDPAMMTALLLYAYAVGERSTRAIERRLVEDVAFRVIAANQVPDHTTISRFRVRHERALAGLFGEVLVLCQRAGLVRPATVAVDGTKLSANASLDANRSYEWIKADVERYLRESAEIDAAEDELYGDRRGDELPPELADPVSRRAALDRAKAELEAEHAKAKADWEAKQARRREHIERTGRRPAGRPPSAPPQEQALFAAKRNLTDLDSRVVRDKGALIQGYNAQIVVGEGQVILAAGITNSPLDNQQLEPMITAARDELDKAGIDAPIKTVLADTGYWNSGHMNALHDAGLTSIIPPAPRGPRAPRRSARGPKRGPHADRITEILASDQGAALYRRRAPIVEPVFAHIRHLRGITRFARRGLSACTAEWQLIAATHNLLKLYRAAPAT